MYCLSKKKLDEVVESKIMKNRQSNFVKIAKYLSAIDLSFLKSIESYFVKKSNNNEEPYTIFILGLPRSGTTLTYQCFLNAFNINYLSNLGHFLYQLPYFGNKISGTLSKKYRSNFHSNEGYVSGLLGPAEGLHFWKKWMGADIIESKNIKATATEKSYIKHVLRNVSSTTKPFVTCYLGHVLTIDELKRDFPNALFIVLKRDKVANSLSLLRCRQKQDEPKSWFSVKPTECQNLIDENEYQQIIRQVNSLNCKLDAIALDDNTFTVDYGAICDNPNLVMSNFKTFALNKGYTMLSKYKLPDNFINKFNPEDSDALIFNDLFEKNKEKEVEEV